jgi:3-deoxy-7-phosphoheptulonate synthase
MIIVMRSSAKKEDIELVANKVASFSFTPHVIEGVERTVIGVIGDGNKDPIKSLVNLNSVDKVFPVSKPYKLAARSSKEEDTIIKINNFEIGGDTFVIMAGPCSVESRDQMDVSAKAVAEHGGVILRGGAYKPRTSPYSFQGLEEEGLQLLRQAGDKYGLPIITELVSVDTVEKVAEYTDIIQIGARNMQNFPLLRSLGGIKKPILLKRGLSGTLEELVMAAEYIMSGGNYDVMLCERGIRTFETAYRNTLDLNAVPALKKMTHLPIIVDPSHGTGRVDLIPTMSNAAVAAGAHGIIVEVHPNPSEALSDGPQALTPDMFKDLVNNIRPFVKAAGKKLAVVNA